MFSSPFVVLWLRFLIFSVMCMLITFWFMLFADWFTLTILMVFCYSIGVFKCGHLASWCFWSFIIFFFSLNIAIMCATRFVECSAMNHQFKWRLWDESINVTIWLLQRRIDQLCFISRHKYHKKPCRYEIAHNSRWFSQMVYKCRDEFAKSEEFIHSCSNYIANWDTKV